MFKRKIERVINQYFDGDKNKILVIDGARQIGKTYIIRKLSKANFENYIEINLKDDFDNDRVFEKVKSVKDFYLQVSLIDSAILNNKDDTIIFLDEIQVYPHLLTLLKPLNQDAKYTYIVSGSLLGITLKHTFIPMRSIYETAATMELTAHGHELYYFDSKKVGEVDFLINDYANVSILPIEIKSGNDQYNYRAIPKLVDKNGNYKLKKGYIFGNKNIVEYNNDLITLPIYLIMFV